MKQLPLMVEPVPVLDELTTYSTGRPESGLDLILDFNERLTPPFTIADLDDAREWQVNRYPELGALEPSIARRLGVPVDSILVTGGADDALERTVRSVCTAGRNAIMTTPSYGMIRRFIRIAGAELEEIPWWRGGYPVEEVLAAADESTALVCVVSPNNPTGSVASADELREILETLPRSLVLLDQAYVDFTNGENDLAPVALEYPNAVVVRTFSKAWGGAGLRVGFAMGDPRVVDWLRRIGLPFPVSTPSLRLAASMLDDEDQPGTTLITAVRRQRRELSDELADLGIEVLPSEGSFVFARFPAARRVWRWLHAFGISIRAFHGRPETDGWLRITLPGDEPGFERIRHALRTILAPEALLFDMDGVLVDVSRSYRQAILQTAASFGVELDSEDVEQANAEGDANNDWELTRRLIAAQGVEQTLDEVTKRFEQMYQGSESQPGLRNNEKLMVPPDRLRSLAGRIPLAVVTGRPRADAERFLNEHSISDCFSAVVTMEDGPLKPDPAPVRRALEKLGVRHAWMVGDTPDDIRAADAAGVLPLGVVAPGDDPKATCSSLTDSGAAEVFNTANQVLEVLP
jgi:histidinol-phosphate aminotransferase